MRKESVTHDFHPSLFDEPLRHDYGDAAGDGEDYGHEYPFVRAGVSPKVLEDEVKHGVSVPLAARRLAVQAVADMYARHNRGEGMKKAVATPYLRREIEPRYFDVDYVAERAAINGQYTPIEERAMLQPILKEQELLAAGFEDAEVDLVAKSIIYEARQQFGIGVRSDERQRNLRKIR
ncbi:hypothetical protein GII36_05315 [Candidatus Mycosynbacter amalyticus]|uniref:Uncharacterized protein n=1 Tax=Candidatus Mycosynbacter amalyticus TaxID=2665156 RepID=A0A857MKZ8_9BACT|nr:hypothetical protein [Candidatus Mycosynbacter amalyticus]QHN43236.1 hypothetical protein GII36_05315 [Candidatus Mycosynbacter amalyticus]